MKERIKTILKLTLFAISLILMAAFYLGVSLYLADIILWLLYGKTPVINFLDQKSTQIANI